MAEEAGEVSGALLQLEARSSTFSGLNRSQEKKEGHSLQLASHSPCSQRHFPDNPILLPIFTEKEVP